MKKWVSLLLVLSMLLGILSSCAKSDDEELGFLSNLENVEMLTREDWVVLLGQTFGMDQYMGEASYFSDVSQTSSLYPYAQSCYEWELFVYESSQLCPDELASREFVAVTALLATGIYNELEKEQLLEVALNECIVYVENGDWEAPISYAEGVVAATIARELYLNYIPEDIIVIVTTENATDLTHLTPDEISFYGSSYGGQTSTSPSETDADISTDDTIDDVSEDEKMPQVDDNVDSFEDGEPEDYVDVFGKDEMFATLLEVDSEIAEDWETGTIFMAPPTEYYPEGFPYKVVSIEIDGDVSIVEVDTPTFEEMYEELYVNATLTPDFSNMVLAEGFTLTGIANSLSSSEITPRSVGNPIYISHTIENVQSATKLSTGTSATFSVSLTNGKMAITPEWDNQKLKIDRLIPTLPTEATGVMLDDLTKFEETNFVKSLPFSYGSLLDTDETRGWEEVLNVEDKFSGGYDVSGSLELKNFQVSTTIDWKYFMPQKLVIQVSGDITPSLKVTGKLDKEIAIGTVPIPVPQVPGLTIELSLFLYTSVSGEIAVKVVCSNSCKLEYSSGSVKRAVNNTVTPELESKIDIEGGAGFSAGLAYLKQDFIDVSAKIGVNLSAEGSVKIEKTSTTEETTVDNEISSVKTSEITLSISSEAKLAYPIVTLEVGGKSNSWANKLGLKYTWNITDKNNAKNNITLFSEIKPFYTITVTEDVLDEDIEESEENLELEDGYNEFASLVMDKILFTLDAGNSEQIKFSSFPSGENINHVTFYTTDSSIAQVSSTGNITGVGDGTAYVYARTPSGGYQVCVVSVTGDEHKFTADDFL